MRHPIRLQAILLYALLPSGFVSAQVTSDLWGKDGERWSTESRLPDFSFAGYRCGEAALPTGKATTDVLRFGARGDGKTDCTEALRRAIAATDRGVIQIPAGRYVLRDMIRITKPGIVLRGAGPGRTVIFCPRNLEDVRPNMGRTTSGRRTSRYSWSGGFFQVQGNIRRDHVANMTHHVRRGSTEVKIDAPRKPLRPGQFVTIEITDDAERTLLDQMYAGEAGDTSRAPKPGVVHLANRVVSLRKNHLTLERPLRLDLRTSWSPVVKTWEPTVTEVGIEDLTIEFPVKPYRGHFT
ncbi:MAG: glycosyl hydrolase family 28-related protein, partial [Verrucomicrobiota bacterium]